ncbi:MAG: TadE/TadG family type IV pilus assembly protein [Rhodovulum sp.]
MEPRTLAPGFWRDDRGAITALGLFMAATMMLVGAVAVDIAYAYRARAELQNAADAVAHAALFTRELDDSDASKDKALALLETSFPTARYGGIIGSSDIEFGTWDPDTHVFTPDPLSDDATRVVSRFSGRRGNALGMFLMRLVGEDAWDVSAESVFETYRPTCFREGFVAQDVVDVQSNNVYTNGFCIHSNTHVKVSSGNFFADSTIVSMPDKNDLELPNSGFESNDGLYEALRDGVYRMRILNRLPMIVAELEDPVSELQPDYITSVTVLHPEPTAKKLLPEDFTEGHVHTLSCNGKGSVTFQAGTYSNMVFVTDCDLKFNNGVILDNVVIATTSTDPKSINAPSGLQIGRDDHCAPDGGAQVITFGGFDVASDLKIFGGQILALGDIAFSANANGIEGASFVAMGTISGTSNMTMGFCGSGMERNFEAEFFRLVQ